MPRNFTNRDSFLKDIAKRVQLREGAEGAERVLRAIYSYTGAEGPLTERALSRIVRMPVPVIAAIRRELGLSGMLANGADDLLNALRFNDEAIATIQARWGWGAPPARLAPEPSSTPHRASRSEAPATVTPVPAEQSTPQQPRQLCEQCDGMGIAPAGSPWQAALSALSKYGSTQTPTPPVTGRARRITVPSPGVTPESDTPYNPLPPETALRRVALLHEHAALAGKDVLVLGDDVSVSAALAIAGKELGNTEGIGGVGGKLARRIVALHKSDKPLRALRDIAVSEEVIIGLVTHSLSKPLLPDLTGEFSTVLVSLDIPASPETLALYLSRAIEALRPHAGMLLLSMPLLDATQRLDTQHVIFESGFAIERALPEPNNSGYLYLLQATPDTAPLIEGDYDSSPATFRPVEPDQPSGNGRGDFH